MAPSSQFCYGRAVATPRIFVVEALIIFCLRRLWAVDVNQSRLSLTLQLAALLLRRYDIVVLGLADIKL